ncbi:hypothetical protein MMC29_001003 [Sticta canariensis]|nr:hypothetical protein [Sticta canariensis]
MGQDSKTYLAARILNDGRLSSRKPGSVHATYLVSGTQAKLSETSVAGVGRSNLEDADIQSSPFISSSLPPRDDAEDIEDMPSVKVIALVREQDLEVIKTKYQEISSIHIYSLGPSSTKSLQILSDCNREISEEFAKEDSSVFGRQYGTIQNFRVKRRTGQRSASVLPVSTSIQPKNTTVSKSQVTGGSKSKIDESANEKIPYTKASSQAEVKPMVQSEPPPKSEKRAISKISRPKREQPDIFKSFSKPKPKLSKEDTENSAGTSLAVTTTSSQESSSAHDDEPMKDASEDEQAEDFINEARFSSKPARSKSEREEQLRMMMDEEDEVMKDVAGESGHPSAGSQESAPIDNIAPQQVPSPEPHTMVSEGRRRGRRKIMKKKTLKDDEGYLVTKEEPAWESFSEDEPLARKDRAPVSTAPLSGKGKKIGGKPGQGNIMSFFSKK